MATQRVGVLALQGDYQKHTEVLSQLAVTVHTVRRPSELDTCDALVVPGGESTTVRRMLRISELEEPLLAFAQDRPVLGTCAGLILLAKRLEDAGGVEPLGVLDVDVRRNGFGRQVDSFAEEIRPTVAELGEAAPAVFIRAPRITRVGNDVEVLATYRQEPVAVRQGRHLALSFHPELSGDSRWHAFWLQRS